MHNILYKTLLTLVVLGGSTLLADTSADRIVIFMNKYQKDFCQKAPIIGKSIRSGNGKYCDESLGAALALAVCQNNISDFEKSECATKANRLLSGAPPTKQIQTELILQTPKGVCDFIASILGSSFKKDDCIKEAGTPEKVLSPDKQPVPADVTVALNELNDQKKVLDNSFAKFYDMKTGKAVNRNENINFRSINLKIIQYKNSIENHKIDLGSAWVTSMLKKVKNEQESVVLKQYIFIKEVLAGNLEAVNAINSQNTDVQKLRLLEKEFTEATIRIKESPDFAFDLFIPAVGDLNSLQYYKNEIKSQINAANKLIDDIAKKAKVVIGFITNTTLRKRAELSFEQWQRLLQQNIPGVKQLL